MYMPIVEIIDQRWTPQISRPLHAAAFYLNPDIHYTCDFKSRTDVKLGLYACLDKMIPEKSELVKVHIQFDRFKAAKGLFGMESAILTRSKKAPGNYISTHILIIFFLLSNSIGTILY